MDFGQKMFSRKLIYLISRVFLLSTFLNFLQGNSKKLVKLMLKKLTAVSGPATTEFIESSIIIALFKFTSLSVDEEIALDILEAGEASLCKNVYGLSLGLEFRSGILGNSVLFDSWMMVDLLVLVGEFMASMPRLDMVIAPEVTASAGESAGVLMKPWFKSGYSKFSILMSETLALVLAVGGLDFCGSVTHMG